MIALLREDAAALQTVEPKAVHRSYPSSKCQARSRYAPQRDID